MVTVDKRNEDTSMGDVQMSNWDAESFSSDIRSKRSPLRDSHALGLGPTGSTRGSHGQWPLPTPSPDRDITPKDEEFLSTLDGYTLVDPPMKDGQDNNSMQEQLELYLNDASSLSKGHILSRSGKTEYTIILVGETGVGKTSLLTFIWNILDKRQPHEYRLHIHDRSNESGLGSGESQTNDAKLYTFTSRNGVDLRILDTPGLADTRGMHLDNQHKERIAQTISDLIVTVDAVLIVANGTSPRLTASSSYTLTSLSSMFPKTLANNIAMLFTNVADSMSRNFERTSLPVPLQKAEAFCINNPTALEARRRVDPGTRPSARARQINRVAEAHEDALETMADFFEWLDTRSPQPTNDIVALYEYSSKIERQILNTQSQLAQAMNATQALERFRQTLIHSEADLTLFRTFDSIVLRRTFDLERSKSAVNICHYPGCHENCHIDCNAAEGFFWWMNPKRCYDCWGHTLNLWVYPKCKTCHHDHSFHSLSNSEWVAKEHASDAGDAATRESLFNSLRTEEEQFEHFAHEIDAKLAYFARQRHENMEALAQLAESYEVHALSGNYSTQLEEGIRISKENIRAMCEKGADEMVIAKMRVSVSVLEKKLTTLKDAQAKKQQRIYSVKDEFLSSIDPLDD